jgi:S1-C subfamily serine protease
VRKTYVSILTALFCCGILVCLYGQEQDYNRLFHSLKSFTGPVDLSKAHAQPIESNAEIKSVLENGLNSANLFAPYAKEGKDLKSIVRELSNFHFALRRGGKSVEIYQKAVHSTVLIVAPDIGCGAGYVIDGDRGLIITNYHVTSGLKNLLVAFYDENVQDPEKMKFIPATVIKYSAKRDVAVLRLSMIPSGLQPINFEESERPAVGETVHTIGHPLSLTWTYSSGTITALRNQFQFGEEQVADVIQIDASISPGNSGGPLIDDSGNLIGMITFYSGAQHAQNLNFALSTRDIKAVLSSPGNEDTSKSTALQKLVGLGLPSLDEIWSSYKAYQVESEGNGQPGYISLRNQQTGKEVCRYCKGIEIELEPGKKTTANMLGMDIANRGAMDLIMIDVNSDNRFELVLLDINQDGKPDIIGVDTEGKGIVTEAWIL